MQRMSRRATRLSGAAALAAAVAVMAAGCTASANPEPSETEIELLDRAPAGAGDVAEIVWNLPQGEPATIDPPNSPTYSGAGVVSNLCDPLVAVDEDYNLGPNLADWEQVSPTELVFTLRDDATFWDGTPVTPQDVVFSLNRAAGPDSIVAFVFENIAAIEAVGDSDVRVTFSQPDVLFLPSMATFSGMIIQQAFTEAAGSDFGTSAAGVMCSGPYKYVEWVPGDSITIERNDTYWNEELPLAVGKVTFEFVTDSTAATQAVNAGEIDGSYQVDPAAIPALRSSSAANVYFGPSMESVNLSVALPTGPMADPAMREAFQVMIDRDALAQVVYHGAAEPLYTAVTPRTWPNSQVDLYQAQYDEWAAKRAYDPERAKELVEQSDYDGESIGLGILAGDATLSKVAQLIQQQGEASGITIEIKEIQPLEYSTAAYDTAVRERLGLDLLIGSSFNAAQEPLEPIGFSYIAGAYYNYTGLDDPEINRLVAEARETIDEAERAELTTQAIELIEAASPTIGLVSTNTVTALNKELGGAITSFAYMSMPAMAYIAAAAE